MKKSAQRRRNTALTISLIMAFTMVGCGNLAAAPPPIAEESVEPAEISDNENSKDMDKPENSYTGELSDAALASIFGQLNERVVKEAEGKTVMEDEDLYSSKVMIYPLSSLDPSEIDVYFVRGENDIPYISLTDCAGLLNEMAVLQFPDSDMAELIKYGIYKDNGRHMMALVKGNGSYASVWWDYDYIFVSDVDSILLSAAKAGDVVSCGAFTYDLAGDLNKVEYVEHVDREEKAINEGYGVYSYLNDEYGIQLIHRNEELYLPIATVNDLFFGDSLNLIYNGTALFVTQGALENRIKDEDGKTQYDLFYETKSPSERSKELAEYTYHELCMYLDMQYGLKDQHNITSFDEYFTTTGLIKDLKSTDGQVFDRALAKLVISYFDDIHSAYRQNSAYAGKDFRESLDWEKENDCARRRSYAYDKKIASYRKDAGLMSDDGRIVNGYEEIGDTAYITFDEFLSAMTDYYSMVDEDGTINMEELEACYDQDTFGLVIYSNAMIRRDNSPIKKVVIDLSGNGGGAANAAAYLSAWVLGSSSINSRNYTTHSVRSFDYRVDTNLDGEITSEDSLDLDSLDVYCLISTSSFSCGNLVPSMFKSDGRVTLLGQKTGGGACVVAYSAAADGTIFRISGTTELCIVKNGSYYSVDEGVEPDIYFKHIDKFYDRKWLTEYLNSIN